MIQWLLLSILSTVCPEATDAGVSAANAQRLLERADDLLSIGTQQVVHLEVNSGPDSTWPTLSLSYFERNDEQIALVFESPVPLSGLVVATNKDMDFLVKLPGLRHVQSLRLAGRARRFLGTEFRLNDLLDLHLSQRYVACRLMERETNTHLVLRPRAEIESTDNGYLEVTINRENGLVETMAYLNERGDIVRRQTRRRLVTANSGERHYSEITMHNFETGRRSVVDVTRIERVSDNHPEYSSRRWVTHIGSIVESLQR